MHWSRASGNLSAHQAELLLNEQWKFRMIQTEDLKVQLRGFVGCLQDYLLFKFNNPQIYKQLPAVEWNGRLVWAAGYLIQDEQLEVAQNQINRLFQSQSIFHIIH